MGSSAADFAARTHKRRVGAISLYWGRNGGGEQDRERLHASKAPGCLCGIAKRHHRPRRWPRGIVELLSDPLRIETPCVEVLDEILTPAGARRITPPRVGLDDPPVDRHPCSGR